MAEHVFETHTKCEIQHCAICDGGLAVCTVCGGAEGSLTAECCGQQMTGDQLDDVYNGHLNYTAGEWRQFEQRLESRTETIEPASIAEFWRCWDSGQFAGCRLGQAFYNHFNLSKMADQSVVGPLYNMETGAAYAFIRDIHAQRRTLTAKP